MREILGLTDGGSDVISYALFWNSGSGSVFTEVVGETTDNLDRYPELTPLTNGQAYVFRYKVRNIHGWSEFSDDTTIYSAKAPDAPLIPTTSIVGLNFRIEWSLPNDNGLPLTAYKIEILSSTANTWFEQTANCDGSNSVIRNARECVIPLTTLRTTPFNLALGVAI